jgi:hypothetical protein
MMRTRNAAAPFLGLLVLLLALPESALSQTTGRSGAGAGAGADATQPTDIAEAGARLGRAWASGDMDQFSRYLSRQGIYLRLGGFDRASLSARLAEAALRDFLRGFEQGQVQLVRTVLLAGQPRGFAEFRWQTRVPGTSHAMTQFIFMGLTLEEGSWRVSELRILP